MIWLCRISPHDKNLCLRRLFFSILLFFSTHTAQPQTLGGTAVYNFLNLPSSPMLSASGGVNTSYAANDMGLAMNNPALLNPLLDAQVAFHFNAFFAGIKGYQLTGARYSKKLNTTFGGGLFYLDYGRLPQTDAAGNEQGFFRPVDFVLQASASKKYLEKWQYGLSTKFIYSSYQQFKSAGAAIDFGLLYNDTANFFSAGLLAKNMGVQLSGYTNRKEEIPFDLQIGLTKRLAKSPFGFSLTAQQVHRFNLEYNDTSFNRDNNFIYKSSFANKVFNHLVFAAHVYLSKNLEASLGYNFLRRTQLNLGASGNGLNGFSAGFKMAFNKLEVQYARAYFQRSGAYNQFGIGLHLAEVFRNNL